MTEFPCEKCGRCCRESEYIPPKFKGKDGVCIHLKNNLCDIYEDRPLICNLGAYYDFMASTFVLTETKEQFFRKNKQRCKEK
jgi:Fe-S-cluster containining protein